MSELEELRQQLQWKKEALQEARDKAQPWLEQAKRRTQEIERLSNRLARITDDDVTLRDLFLADTSKVAYERVNGIVRGMHPAFYTAEVIHDPDFSNRRLGVMLTLDRDADKDYLATLVDSLYSFATRFEEERFDRGEYITVTFMAHDLGERHNWVLKFNKNGVAGLDDTRGHSRSWAGRLIEVLKEASTYAWYRDPNYKPGSGRYDDDEETY